MRSQGFAGAHCVTADLDSLTAWRPQGSWRGSFFKSECPHNQGGSCMTFRLQPWKSHPPLDSCRSPPDFNRKGRNTYSSMGRTIKNLLCFTTISVCLLMTSSLHSLHIQNTLTTCRDLHSHPRNFCRILTSHLDSGDPEGHHT